LFSPSAPGGAEGTRTPALISAIDALSQLSYSPNSVAKSIIQNEILVKCDCLTLP
jgi:hypothetical protein